MKKLLLLAGIVGSIVAHDLGNFEEYQKLIEDKDTQNNFNVLLTLEDELLSSVRVGAGAIPCDIINQFSQEERDALKNKARLTADSDKHNEILSVILYNNIIYCESNRTYKIARSKFIEFTREERIARDERDRKQEEEAHYKSVTIPNLK